MLKQLFVADRVQRIGVAVGQKGTCFVKPAGFHHDTGTAGDALAEFGAVRVEAD